MAGDGGLGSRVRDAQRTEVLNLCPKSQQQIPSFNIVVAGEIGAGKSSLINSFNSVLKDRLSSCKAQAGRGQKSVTEEFFKYEIWPTITISDTMGLKPDCKQDNDLRDILQAVDGHVPHKHKFGFQSSPRREFNEKSEGYIQNPKPEDKPHCVAVVINAQTVSVMVENMKRKLRTLASELIKKRMPFFIILTHLDKLSSAVGRDVTTMFKNRRVRDLVIKVGNIMNGLPLNQIYPVINYTECVKMDPNKDILLLCPLRQMLYDSQDYIETLEQDLTYNYEIKLDEDMKR